MATIDRQISLPFSFGAGGGAVETTTSLSKQMQDHVFACVGSQLGERVMSPTYGTDLVEYVFAPVDDMTEQAITASISAALALHVPEVTIAGVNFVSADPNTGLIVVQIEYALSAAAGTSTTVTTTIPIAVSV